MQLHKEYGFYAFFRIDGCELIHFRCTVFNVMAPDDKTIMFLIVSESNERETLLCKLD
jgi:hypothetical protein